MPTRKKASEAEKNIPGKQSVAKVPSTPASAPPARGKGAATKSARSASAKRTTTRKAKPPSASASKSGPSGKKAAAKRPSRSEVASNHVTEADSAADLVDTQLAKYRSMRDFSITAEPAGALPQSARKAPAKSAVSRSKQVQGLPFVIQKHAASHMHYDFRLGWSGVLKSWAVAKGPSYVVADKRLAVQVEDHPMEYGGFEGVIPKGQYGGGTVMVWDQGTWWPQLGHENVDAGLRSGSLKFEMNGVKMRGKWTLIRMHTTRPAPGEGSGRWRSSDKPQWLLIKEHDDFERPASAPAITEEAPDSALTGRTMDQIAHQSDHIWNSKETAGEGQAWIRQDNPPQAPVKSEKQAALDPASALRIAPRPRTSPRLGPVPRTHSGLAPELSGKLTDLPREPQPEFLAPQLAQETETPPEGQGWLHELKLDGYRMQARKSARGVQMLTRSGLDWTYRVPSIADDVAQLPVDTATLDGEVVVLADDGTTNFADLQASFQNGDQHPLTYFCFDLLHLEGRNPRSLPLRDRKALLAGILPHDEAALVRLSEHIEDKGREMFEQACRLHAEGIVSKRGDEPYQVGRRSGWLKSKCLHEQEFVVGGFTLSSDGPDRIGSLLLGYYESKGVPNPRLIFAGRTGTGFTQKQRRDLRSQLAPLQIKSPVYAHVPPDQRRGALWVRPELVAQVRFATWTAEDLVRQAAFLGLREDKEPREVFREKATAAPQPKRFVRKSLSSAVEKGSARNHPQTPAADAPTSSTAKSQSLKAASVSSTSPAKTNHAPNSAPVRLTHPSKILDPESSLTKQQLADFYWAVADRMLPHIADRPLSLVRCPEGAGKPCFYQKHVNSMLPPGIGSVMVADKKGGKPEPYITLNTPEALAGLAQMGVLEIHPWSSRNETLECPDRLIFDLDPDESLPWQTVASAAREVKQRLGKIGLESFLKTTGGKGLHIVAPVLPQHDFPFVKDFAHQFVAAMERANPRLYLTRMTKAARTGKIYLDYLRNERGATAVAPFSPRARSGVSVSVPLDWKELSDEDRPLFTVAEFPQWAARLRRDPWRRMTSLKQTLDLNRLRLL